jgi:hypothetical protein
MAKMPDEKSLASYFMMLIYAFTLKNKILHCQSKTRKKDRKM